MDPSWPSRTPCGALLAPSHSRYAPFPCVLEAPSPEQLRGSTEPGSEPPTPPMPQIGSWWYVALSGNAVQEMIPTLLDTLTLHSELGIHVPRLVSQDSSQSAYSAPLSM